MPRPTVTSVHTEIKAALNTAGVYAVNGPADDLPSEFETTVDGFPVRIGGAVRQAAVLWPSPGFHTYTRVSGSSSGRVDRVLITCVGATTFDALAVADAVEAAIGGLRLSGGDVLRQTLATQPSPEPNADPRRVSLAVEYTTITKG